jgi:hypothetical protein
MLYILTILTGMVWSQEADKVTILRGRYDTVAACAHDAKVIVLDPALPADRWIKATCRMERGV